MTEAHRPKGEIVLQTGSQVPDKQGRELFEVPQKRRILQAVVDHHQNNFAYDSNFSRVGEYDTYQVWGAFKEVTQDLLDTHNEEFLGKIKKGDAKGGLMLGMDKTRVPGTRDEGTIIALQYLRKGNGVALDGLQDAISCQIPVDDNALLSNHPFIGFSNRWDRHNAKMNDLKENFDIEKFQDIWLGHRWIAANLLNWDKPGIILAEDVDKL